VTEHHRVHFFKMGGFNDLIKFFFVETLPFGFVNTLAFASLGTLFRYFAFPSFPPPFFFFFFFFFFFSFFGSLNLVRVSKLASPNRQLKEPTIDNHQMIKEFLVSMEAPMSSILSLLLKYHPTSYFLSVSTLKRIRPLFFGVGFLILIRFVL